MNALVIYDNTGKIYYIGYGDTEAPQGLRHKFIFIPVGKELVTIDTSTDEPVFRDTGSAAALNQEVSDLRTMVNDMSAIIDSLLLTTLNPEQADHSIAESQSEESKSQEA